VDTSEVGLQVQEELRKQKLDRFRTFCQILCVMVAPFTVNLMISISKREVRGRTLAQDFVHLAEQGLAALIIVFPGALSQRTIDMFYAILVLGLAAYIAPFISCSDFLIQSLIVVNCILGLMTVVRGTDTLIVPLLNLLVVISACCSIFRHGDDLAMQPQTAMSSQVLAGIILTGVAHVLEKGSQASMRQCLEMQSIKEKLSAACTLLRSCCDAVLELDREGTIACPAKDLGSFLQWGPGQRLQGRRLVDLMSNALDRQLFARRFGSTTLEGMSLADAAQVSMMDDYGNALRLELLWSHFRSPSGERRYMLCVRESGEPDQQQQDGKAEPEHAAGAALPKAPSVSSNLPEEGPVVAVLDCSTDGFPITDLSTAFCTHVGRLPPAARLLHAARRSERAGLQAWLQEALCARAQKAGPPEDCRLTLRMPQGEMQVMCSVLRDERSQGAGGKEEHQKSEAAGDLWQVCLLFYDIRNVHRWSTSRRPTRILGRSQSKGAPSSKTSL